MAVVPRAMTLVMVLFFAVFGCANAREPFSSAPSAGSSGMASRSQGLTIQLSGFISNTASDLADTCADGGPPQILRPLRFAPGPQDELVPNHSAPSPRRR